MTVLINCSTKLADIVRNSRRLISEGYYDLDHYLLPKIANTRENLSKAIEKSPFFPIVVELKFQSPNMCSERLSTLETARIPIKSFIRAGVTGLSILTEPRYFHGSLQYLAEAATMFPGLPILMKDFIVDTTQIDAAKAFGASTILLIAKILSRDELIHLIQYAHSLDLEILLEVNTREEMELALSTNAQIIGINNRDLTTFDVNLETTEKLSSLFPNRTKLFLSLSGINSKENAHRMKKAGVDGILVGTALMKASDPISIINKLKEV
ncbi:MAG: indole-3-glycerol-phosphate synthase [Candidatus Hodarchaeota archaeon]